MLSSNEIKCGTNVGSARWTDYELESSINSLVSREPNLILLLLLQDRNSDSALRRSDNDGGLSQRRRPDLHHLGLPHHVAEEQRPVRVQRLRQRSLHRVRSKKFPLHTRYNQYGAIFKVIKVF